MEMLDKGFVGSTFKETRAVHEEGPTATELAQQQNDAVDRGAGTEQQVETIRNVGDRVRRNDPCPCGSGKKYKSCLHAKDSSQLVGWLPGRHGTASRRSLPAEFSKPNN